MEGQQIYYDDEEKILILSSNYCGLRPPSDILKTTEHNILEIEPVSTLR
jgi:hypothetical protein